MSQSEALEQERKTLERLERIRRVAREEGALGTPGLDADIAATRREILRLEEEERETSCS